MKKKPATRQLPFQHTLYDRLQATEGRLDHLLIRKRLDVQEAISRSMRTKQVLRLFFSNTCYDDSANTGTKQWTLKIEARVLGSPHSAKKMSHYLKQIVIQLADAAAAAAVPAVANNNNDAAMDTSDTQDSTQTITWHKSPAAPASDGFEIKRSTTTHQQSIQARILITPDYVPERFHLSDALSALLNLQDETKPNVILGLWQYIKVHAPIHSFIHNDHPSSWSYFRQTSCKIHKTIVSLSATSRSSLSYPWTPSLFLKSLSFYILICRLCHHWNSSMTST